MVELQLRARGIADERLLTAMRRVPRHEFAPEQYRSQAYEDYPLPIAEGQTISQPYIVALMLEALALSPSDKVLEVGTGSGYVTALLAEMVSQVISIERHPVLADSARAQLATMGYRKCHRPWWATALEEFHSSRPTTPSLFRLLPQSCRHELVESTRRGRTHDHSHRHRRLTAVAIHLQGDWGNQDENARTLPVRSADFGRVRDRWSLRTRVGQRAQNGLLRCITIDSCRCCTTCASRWR